MLQIVSYEIADGFRNICIDVRKSNLGKIVISLHVLALVFHPLFPLFACAFY
jgi:hypothetical protein